MGDAEPFGILRGKGHLSESDLDFVLARRQILANVAQACADSLQIGNFQRQAWKIGLGQNVQCRKKTFGMRLESSCLLPGNGDRMQDTEMAEGRKITRIVSGSVFLPRQALYLPRKCLSLPGTFGVWMRCLCLWKEDLKKKTK